jgi:hypothetical protein
MDKDASLFNSLDKFVERKIHVIDDFSLDIIGHGNVPCQHGRIVDIYYVSHLSVNLLSLYQLTQTNKIVELYPDCFFVKYLNKGQSIVVGGFLDPKDNFYKFCDSTRPDFESTALISHNDERSRIWHE